jgi:two-component system LytT family response regulator
MYMTLPKLRTILVEDEMIVREKLKESLEESGRFEVVGEANSVETGLHQIITQRPDLVFLDIKLMGGTGFQLLDELRKTQTMIPPVVLNTGYTEFEFAQQSLNEYRDCVVKILRKPFWEDWENKLSEVVTAVLQYQNPPTPTKHAKVTDRMVIRSGHTSFVVHKEDIKFIEVDSEKKGSGKTLIHTLHRQTYPLNKSLGKLLKEMPANTFIRVSRFCAVNQHFIARYDHSEQMLYLQGTSRGIPVNEGFKSQLISFLAHLK